MASVLSEPQEPGEGEEEESCVRGTGSGGDQGERASTCCPATSPVPLAHILRVCHCESSRIVRDFGECHPSDTGLGLSAQAGGQAQAPQDLLDGEGEVPWSALALPDEEGPIVPLFAEHLFCLGSGDFAKKPPKEGRQAGQSVLPRKEMDMQPEL